MLWRTSLVCAVLLAMAPAAVFGAAVVRFGSGAAPADIQGVVDQFRTDVGLGGTNNGVGGSFANGFRNINWDGVPESFAAPNNLPGNFFNSTSPRGALFSTGDGTGFQVSSTNGSGTPVRFGNINAGYANTFQTFTPQRLFTVLDSTEMDVTFFVPGVPALGATVNGFGAVFSDVDLGDSSSIEFFDAGNSLLNLVFVPASPNSGLSFVGVSFTGGERVARVHITSGNAPLGSSTLDGSGIDLVVMDDFMYGEPSQVPETSTLSLLGLGTLVWLAGQRLRRNP
ncbi:MAG TPA: hypothetical protein VGK40_08320 [Verrucomicrobiae bacterium]|jgi:hypothetical protein